MLNIDNIKTLGKAVAQWQRSWFFSLYHYLKQQKQNQAVTERSQNERSYSDSVYSNYLK